MPRAADSHPSGAPAGRSESIQRNSGLGGYHSALAVDDRLKNGELGADLLFAAAEVASSAVSNFRADTAKPPRLQEPNERQVREDPISSFCFVCNRPLAFPECPWRVMCLPNDSRKPKRCDLRPAEVNAFLGVSLAFLASSRLYAPPVVRMDARAVLRILKRSFAATRCAVRALMLQRVCRIAEHGSHGSSVLGVSASHRARQRLTLSSACGSSVSGGEYGPRAEAAAAL